MSLEKAREIVYAVGMAEKIPEKVEEALRHFDLYNSKDQPIIANNIQQNHPLFIVDVQEYFPASSIIIDNVLAAIKRARQESRQIIILECVVPDKPSMNAPEIRIRSALHEYPFVSFVTKKYGIGNWQIKAHIEAYYNEARKMYICGLHYHSCVAFAKRAIKEAGVHPILIRDCIAPIQATIPSCNRHDVVDSFR